MPKNVLERLSGAQHSVRIRGRRKKTWGDGLESQLERKLQDARVTNSGDVAEGGSCR
jgi:hypothetical protein